MTANYTRYLKRCTIISFIAFTFAIIQSSLAILGYWSIDESANERIWFGLAELGTMLILIINSLFIIYFVGEAKNKEASHISRICLYSLIFCFLGDIVNRNFNQLFYQYDDIIKHSYLADSVAFFIPGYLLIMIAVTQLSLARLPNKRFMVISAAIALGIAVITYIDMHIVGTSTLLTLFTGFYSIVVSLLAISALWLIKAFKWREAPFTIWACTLGLFLAMLADAIIGKFWIFGNDGLGYFPIVSHINWIIYIGSQALIQQLPRGILESKNHTQQL